MTFAHREIDSSLAKTAKNDPASKARWQNESKKKMTVTPSQSHTRHVSKDNDRTVSFFFL